MPLKSSPATAAESHDDQVAQEMAALQRPSLDSKQVVRTTKTGPLSGFRKLREALMAQKFESHDNVPVELEAVSGLFIGSYGAAKNYEALTKAGITNILCVSASLPLKFPEVFTYLQLPVADQSSVKISAFFDEAFSFIDSALSSGEKVLVHCLMGRSRSATIVIAYLIARQGLTLSGALRELRRGRPQARPNSGFYQQLVELEAKQTMTREEAN